MQLFVDADTNQQCLCIQVPAVNRTGNVGKGPMEFTSHLLLTRLIARHMYKIRIKTLCTDTMLSHTCTFCIKTLFTDAMFRCICIFCIKTLITNAMSSYTNIFCIKNLTMFKQLSQMPCLVVHVFPV